VQVHLKRAHEAAILEASTYPAQLRARLKEVGVHLRKAPKSPHADLVGRAIERRRPFDENGSGYRDTLHWMIVLDVVDERYEETDIVFVSAGRRAFGAAGKADKELHPHLVAELEVRDVSQPYFRWVQEITNLVVPGVFYSTIEPGSEISLSAAEVGS